MPKARRYLVVDRHLRILELVAKEGSLDLQTLADDLGVSVMTIRRDVKDLSARGQLSVTRGGASVIITQDHEILTNPRALNQTTQKAAIGQFAATMVEAGDVMFIGTGSTTAQLAQFLDPGLGLTVVTPSLPHATVLAARGINVISTGGAVEGTDLAQSGPWAIEAIRQHYPRFAFIGAQGVAPDPGLTEIESTIAELNRVAVDHAEQAILLADSTKVGVRAPYRVCPIDRIDQIVTTTGGHQALVDLGLTDRLPVLVA
jgi:DeoR/GlpR family transcriptional regulator of sugar metabolism